MENITNDMFFDYESKNFKIFLDSIPYACSVWDSKYNIMTCNRKLVELLDLSGKQEWTEKFFELSPTHQLNDRVSSELALEYLKKATEDGKAVFEWMHQTPGGELIPVEISIVRIECEKEFILIEYIQDMRKIKNLEKELYETQEQVERVTRQKNDFFSSVGHHIITPMNSIIGMTYLNLLSQVTPRQKYYLERTEESAKSLLHIINNILDYSRLQSGILKLENNEFSLKIMIQEISDDYAQDIANNNIEYSVDIPDALPEFIIGDPVRINQILRKIIKNAVKYTVNGSVGIKMEILNQTNRNISLKFTIKDSGAGMTQDQIEGLFQAFSKEHEMISGKYGETGIEFTVVQSLISLMHGNISCKSKIGEGTAFIFDICLALPEQKSNESLAGIDLQENASEDIKKDDPLLLIPESIKGSRILVAEDNEVNQILIVELLTMAGFKADVVANGAEAVKMSGSEHYDLILMDIQMPVMDGITATHTIKRENSAKNTPIIAMTAYVMAEDKKAILDAGMDDYVKKPIDPSYFYATLRKWLKPVKR